MAHFSDHTIDDIINWIGSINIQANLENVRELRNGMLETETNDIANFTSAFTTAFEILAKVCLFSFGV